MFKSHAEVVGGVEDGNKVSFAYPAVQLVVSQDMMAIIVSGRVKSGDTKTFYG